jgi:uncharacterized protein with HEPN domain
MRRKRDDPSRDTAWLLDMLTAAHAVEAFVAGRTLEQYKCDLMLRSAVERQIEIVGEAAGALTQLFKAAHPQIPWRQIMAQRHRLAHEYGEIDDALIWRVATIHIPALISEIEPLLPETPYE